MNSTDVLLAHGIGQAVGNATPSQVLTGSTFSTVKGLQTGTMPNNGAVTITPSTSNKTVALGYHNGSGVVQGDPNLVPANILGGKSIFGVIGTAKRQASGSATTDASGMLTVSGLTFQPNMITWSQAANNELMWYNGDGIWTNNYASAFTRSSGSGGSTSSVLTNSGGGYVNATGFSFSTGLLSTLFYWWAYE